MNNDNNSANKTVEVDSDSDDSISCEIINDHQETTGIEVQFIYVCFIFNELTIFFFFLIFVLVE